MAFIPPIVSPLLQMVKDLTAALNETRGYLGLPPIDADALIAKAYGEAPAVPVVTPVDKPNAGAQQGATSNPTKVIPLADVLQGATTQQPETKTEPDVVDEPVCTPDGKYSVSIVSFGAGRKPGFDPKDFRANGIFQLEIAGGKAKFTVKNTLTDTEREDWDTLGAPEVCEGTFQPFLSDAPETVTPGEAVFQDGVWVVTVPAELS